MARLYINQEGGDTIFYAKVGGVATEIMRVDNVGKLSVKSAAATPVSLASNATTVNCANSDIHYGTYTASQSVAIQNLSDGQSILFAATASGATCVLTITATMVGGSSLTVKWAGGTANNSITTGKTSLFQVTRIGTSVYIAAGTDFA